MQRIALLKGRRLSQAGSVTSDPSRKQLPFDWERLPRGLTPEIVMAVLEDFHSLGPIGVRGPAASRVPDHLTVADGLRFADQATYRAKADGRDRIQLYTSSDLAA